MSRRSGGNVEPVACASAAAELEIPLSAAKLQRQPAFIDHRCDGPRSLSTPYAETQPAGKCAASCSPENPPTSAAAQARACQAELRKVTFKPGEQIASAEPVLGR